jgi:hypothetical protein
LRPDQILNLHDFPESLRSGVAMLQIPHHHTWSGLASARAFRGGRRRRVGSHRDQIGHQPIGENLD